MFGTKLTPAEKAAKEARKAREKAAADAQRARDRAERARLQEIQRVRDRELWEKRRIQDQEEAAIRAQRRQERFDAMPVFVVREIREVRVKAEDVTDAINIASSAFKEGQSSDYSVRFGKPFGVEGDTIDKIRTVNIKAVEDD